MKLIFKNKDMYESDLIAMKLSCESYGVFDNYFINDYQLCIIVFKEWSLLKVMIDYYNDFLGKKDLVIYCDDINIINEIKEYKEKHYKE